MRLGFHYHIPAISRNGTIFMPGYLGVFIDSLAEYCEHIVCFMHNPLEGELEKLDYQIKGNNVILVNIGPHASVPNRLLHSAGTRKKILAWKEKIDLMLVRTPTMLIPIFSKKFPVPIALFVIGDYLTGIKQLRQPRLRKILIHLLLKWNWWHQIKIARNSLVIAAGEDLYDKMKPLAHYTTKIKTTTLNTKDFYVRDNTCQNDTINLLFVGRYDKSKGLFELFKAMELLKNGKNKFHLNIAGWTEKDNTILKELGEYAVKLGVEQLVTNHGYKKLGPDLFSLYRKADIYVMPTKFDEFGRTIWEAMAHSLPVVSTKVGSIPLQLTDGKDAVLVEPGDSFALAEVIKKVAESQEFRMMLIKNGRELASQNTLEIQSEKMVFELEKYLKIR